MGPGPLPPANLAMTSIGPRIAVNNTVTNPGGSTPSTSARSNTVVVPPPDPEAVFRADLASLTGGVILRGVLVGAPSLAFVEIDKTTRTLVKGDALPGGFVVGRITNQGIEAVYRRDPRRTVFLSV